MSICRFDVFENEAEISGMIYELQRKGFEYMKTPDDFWHTKTPKLKRKRVRKVLCKC